MFAYCLNNPVTYEDASGDSATIAGGILGGLWGLVAAFTDKEDEDDDETFWEDIIDCVLLGAATGAAAGFVADMSVATWGVGTAAFAWSAAAGAGAGIVNSAGSQYFLDEDVDWVKVTYDALWGGLMGGTCTVMGTNPTAPLGSLKDARIFVDAMTSAEIYMFTTQGYIGAGLGFDIGATAVTSFGAWLSGIVYGHYKSGGGGR